jgi:GH3 auxin-responsive promoter
VPGVPPALANGLWYLSCLREARAFRRALSDVAGTQERLLLATLKRNEGTEYGRRYGFARIRSADEYRERAPLVDYGDYAGAVEKIGAGKKNVLTSEEVLLLEPTSGSARATKLIPYTASLQNEFARGVAAWVCNLFSHDPRLMRGIAYWSITPAARREDRTPGGIPIGFEEDTRYLGARGDLLSRIMAVPPEVRQIEDIESFRYVTLLFLLRARNLALISVWNPTFLTLLMSRLPGWHLRLAHDLETGSLSPPTPLPQGERLSAPGTPDPRRAAQLRAAFRSGVEPATAHSSLWPHLRLLSLWDEAHAALYAPEAARLFPQARIQGKGLISTECFVSLPLTGQKGAVLSLRSHFLEFVPQGSKDETLLAHELEEGGRYSLAVTTGGGLYRYRMGDVVEVTGRFQDCPLIRFLGKEDLVSDRFGEKLNERHASRVLRGTLARHAPDAHFAMLAFEEEPRGYALFIEAEGARETTLLSLADDVEGQLCENHHYRYCRDLGQLGYLRVFRVRRGAAETYQEACRSGGQRTGDIKPVALHAMGDWSHRFEGRFVDPKG